MAAIDTPALQMRSVTQEPLEQRRRHWLLRVEALTASFWHRVLDLEASLVTGRRAPRAVVVLQEARRRWGPGLANAAITSPFTGSRGLGLCLTVLPFAVGLAVFPLLSLALGPAGTTRAVLITSCASLTTVLTFHVALAPAVVLDQERWWQARSQVPRLRAVRVTRHRLLTVPSARIFEVHAAGAAPSKGHDRFQRDLVRSFARLVAAESASTREAVESLLPVHQGTVEDLVRVARLL